MPQMLKSNGQKERRMKIAIPASEKSIASQVNPRFGRCPFFLVFENNQGQFEVLDNSAGQAVRGAGISSAQMLVDNRVEAVIAANIGPNAENALKSANIKIYLADTSLSIEQVLKQFKENKLKQL
jgi:predicted Fe-Mo cluster-binding NifX family protein